MTSCFLSTNRVITVLAGQVACGVLLAAFLRALSHFSIGSGCGLSQFLYLIVF